MWSALSSPGGSTSRKGGPGNCASTTKTGQTPPVPLFECLCHSPLAKWKRMFPVWKSRSSGRKANHSPLSDSQKKAGKFCRNVTVACFHVLVHSNNSNPTINWCSHPQLMNFSLQNSEFLQSYFSHFYYSSFHGFFLYAISESLLYLFLPNMLYKILFSDSCFLCKSH